MHSCKTQPGAHVIHSSPTTVCHATPEHEYTRQQATHKQNPTLHGPPGNKATAMIAVTSLEGISINALSTDRARYMCCCKRVVNTPSAY
jgi:hypothetical protein